LDSLEEDKISPEENKSLTENAVTEKVKIEEASARTSPIVQALLENSDEQETTEPETEQEESIARRVQQRKEALMPRLKLLQ
jgi:hypothetical protein